MWCDFSLQKYPSKRDMGYEKKRKKEIHAQGMMKKREKKRKNSPCPK